ncbi:hypothetical protein Peur_023649 [Populus x canadensis]
MEHCPCPPTRNSKKFPAQESAIHHSQTMTRALYFGAQNGGLMWKGRTLLSASSGTVGMEMEEGRGTTINKQGS